MEDYRININYAKALFIVAADTNQLDTVNDDMRLVNSVCAENHLLNVVFANPVIREDKKIAILKDLFESRISKISMLFLVFVVRKRRAVNLKGISNAFVELFRKDRNIVLAQLVTATEIDDEAMQSVCKAVGEFTQMDVELKAKIDPDILGGFSVAFNNNMYDARISTQVAKMRKEFSKNVYESKL